MRQRVLSFAGRNIFNALVTLLLLIVVSIHAYGWREREQIEDRVWTLEQKAAARDEAIKALEKSLDMHVAVLQKSIQVRCSSIERMIRTLIKVLERRDNPEP